MAGFDLKEGFYEDREVSEDELWDAVACVRRGCGQKVGLPMGSERS